MFRHGTHIRLVALLAALLVPTLAAAADKGAGDPLRVVPSTADFFVKVEEPRQVIDLLVGVAAMKELRGFNQFRELLDSTDYQRFYQLVAHAEKELGKPWPEIVDGVAGNGIALAGKFGEKQAPFMLVLSGKDAELTKKFTLLAEDILKRELERQESKETLKKETKQGLDFISVGKNFFAVRLGNSLVISNVEKGIEAAAALHLGKQSNKVQSIAASPQVAEGDKLAGTGKLAWVWVNFETLRKAPALQELQEFPGELSALYLGIGGWIDAAKRSPFGVAALHREGTSLTLSVRLPKGTKGMNETLARIHTPSDKEPLLPLLQPRGTLATHSFYQNVHEAWQKRGKIFPEDQLKSLEEAEKKSGAFLFGNRFGKGLSAIGSRHRIVVVAQEKSGYRITSPIHIPAFAFVTELRDPETFMRTVEAPLRSIAFLSGLNVKMELVEEQHGPWKIIGYRFQDDTYNRNLNNAILFNFSPCFVRVGNQFILSSTIELAHVLADEVGKKAQAVEGGGPAAKTHLSAKGLAFYLNTIRDQVVTQTLLTDGTTPEEAARQVALLLDLLNNLGGVTSTIRYEPEQFRLDIRFQGK